jgi:hypothetical protein
VRSVDFGDSEINGVCLDIENNAPTPVHRPRKQVPYATSLQYA